jgi:urea transporter
MKETHHIKPFALSILRSYAQIFFSDKIFFAVVLLLVTFFDVYAGLGGFISVFIANGLGLLLGFDKGKVYSGLYGFNALMVGLGLGIYFEPGVTYFFILTLAALLTFFLTITFEGIIGKYTLPFLSIPFLFGIWLVTLATKESSALGISERGVYALNDLYIIGGAPLVNMYTWWNELGIPQSIRTYFISLGAIFFQYNVLSGILISIGLLVYSRIAFLLSLIGFYSAYLFYGIIGAEITEVTYTYIGFNYILTSIALGGYFLIPSRMTYLWVIILIPIVAILTISLNAIFYTFGLSIYSLPFNLIVLIFLYVLKLRIYPGTEPQQTIFQYNSPEKNLYVNSNNKKRFSSDLSYFPVYPPFWGTWTISQGYNGEYTHKEDWRHALDFVIEDEEGKTYRGTGENVEDYYCYDKAIIAPAEGYVVEILDGIEDNKIGDVNLEQNWGNTIIIKHADYLYSKLSHLKAGSFKVYVGEHVKQGQALAVVGSSGRSPEPHLHFQLQATPYIGSKTLEYPFANFINYTEKLIFKSFSIPKQGQKIASVQANELLKKAYHLIPGQTFKLEVLGDGKKELNEWEVCTSPQNQAYIYCHTTKSFAYFNQDPRLFYFKSFEGDKNSALFYFYLSSFKLQLGFYQDLVVDDQILIENIFPKRALILQDLIAPFYIFSKVNYQVRYEEIDDDMSPEKAVLTSKVIGSMFGKKRKEYAFKIELNRKGFEKLTVNTKNKEALSVTCIGY